MKDLSRNDSRIVMHDIPTCANCHSFPADGKTDEAVEHIRKSIELNPRNPAMHANLGQVLFERGNLDEARKEPTRRCASDPTTRSRG